MLLGLRIGPIINDGLGLFDRGLLLMIGYRAHDERKGSDGHRHDEDGDGRDGVAFRPLGELAIEFGRKLRLIGILRRRRHCRRSRLRTKRDAHGMALQALWRAAAALRERTARMPAAPKRSTPTATIIRRPAPPVSGSWETSLAFQTLAWYLTSLS